MTSEQPVGSAEQKIRTKVWVEYPAGTRLSNAGTSGGKSALARDAETNRLVAHATLFPIEEEDETGAAAAPPVSVLVDDEVVADSRSEERLTAEQVAELMELLGVIAVWVARSAPRAMAWWDRQALPVVRSTWGRVARVRKGGAATTAIATTAVAVTAAAEAPVAEGLAAEAPADGARVEMSSAEAHERLAAAVAARVFSDEQLRLLRSARITDSAGSGEPVDALGGLTLEQLRDRIGLALANLPEPPGRIPALNRGQSPAR